MVVVVNCEMWPAVQENHGEDLDYKMVLVVAMLLLLPAAVTQFLKRRPLRRETISFNYISYYCFVTNLLLLQLAIIVATC